MICWGNNTCETLIVIPHTEDDDRSLGRAWIQGAFQVNGWLLEHFIKFLTKNYKDTRYLFVEAPMCSSLHVLNDVGDCGLSGVDPQDRDAWRAGVWCSLVLPTASNGARTAS